jgi:clan AA aspartic protease (TIGR02281 family)
MARLLLAAFTALLASTPVLSQGVDPQAVMDELIRQQMIETQQSFQDRQRQRQLDQQEQSYDRQMCLQTGYTGPDVEQCVRDSAAWRRGIRPNQPSPPIDFSAYGTPAPDEPGTYRRPLPNDARAQPSKTPFSRSDVPVKKSGGIFVVPVEINGTLTLEFGVDSGAADVSIPLDVFSTLKRTGTLRDSDIIGQSTYVLADGSKSQSATFMIRSLKVGDNVVENVTGSVAPSGGMLLLGQSFLGRFKTWSIDNKTQKLVLEPQ